MWFTSFSYAQVWEGIAFCFHIVWRDKFASIQVCSACNLRGSCDRAYVILKEFEADARTVDVVRILLFYALDPLVLSGGERPSGREVIESSVRNLLSQLIKLSESSPAPAPVPARSKLPAQDAVAEDQPLTSMTNKSSKDVEMKKGDWMCPKWVILAHADIFLAFIDLLHFHVKFERHS